MKVPGLTISELADKQVLVLTIEGEIARDQRDLAVEAFLDATRRGTKYIIADFSRTTRISSTVPGLLAYYSKSLPKQGMQLLAVKGPERIMLLLAAMGADRTVPFFNTLDDALEQVRLLQFDGAPEPT